MKALTVGELRILLKNFNDDVPIHILDEGVETEDEKYYDILPTQVRLNMDLSEDNKQEFFVGIHINENND